MGNCEKFKGNEIFEKWKNGWMDGLRNTFLAHEKLIFFLNFFFGKKM